MPAQTLVSLVFGLRCPHRAHGYPRLLGHLLRARRVPRPRRGHRHPVPSGDGWCCSLQGHGTPWTLGSVPFSRLTSHGSLVRVPTHRRARRRPASALSPSCPSQGSLPTCLAGLIGRDSHPLDDASVFLEGHRTSFPYGPALPGRTPAGTSSSARVHLAAGSTPPRDPAGPGSERGGVSVVNQVEPNISVWSPVFDGQAADQRRQRDGTFRVTNAQLPGPRCAGSPRWREQA
jgi:hypothetical protein